MVVLYQELLLKLKDDEEDENTHIKKALIDYFQQYKEQENCGIKTFYGLATENILDWLENQGTPKDIDMSDLKAGTWIVHNTLGTCKIVCLNVTIFGFGYEVISCNDGIKHFIDFDHLSDCHLRQPSRGRIKDEWWHIWRSLLRRNASPTGWMV